MTRPTFSHVRDAALATLLAGFLTWGPAAPLLFHDERLAMRGAPDVGVLLAGLLVFAMARRPVPRLVQHGVVGLWATLGLFGAVWTASLVATRERLPVYDLLLLSQPVWVFTSDLYGPWGPWAVVAGLLVACAGYLGLGAWAWSRLRRLTSSGLARLAAGVVAAIGISSAFYRGFWLVPITTNLIESAELYLAVHNEVRTDLVDRRIDQVRPDIRIYVIESYGDVLWNEESRPVHEAALKALEPTLSEAGWAIASGRATSSTHGGRSWLADATVLSGITIDRQSSFGHLAQQASDIPSLPSFFEDRGYETILVRPKDRARPGVRLVNHFGFAHTVFYDDLAYTGPAIGWGHIPDQFTVERTEQQLIRTLDGPIFAFFHLATAHFPWEHPPPVVDDVHVWQWVPGNREYTARKRSAYSVLRMELSWFKRRTKKKTPKSANLEAYQALVDYDLQVLTRAFAKSPRRPTLMLWFGDHQPPFIANDEPPHTPIHVLATDERWLEPFLADGFLRGLDPGPRGPVTLHHRDLFERITAALAPVEP